MSVPGTVDFELGGEPYSLQVILADPDDDEFFVIFRDQTAEDTTYPAGRYLYARAGVNW